MLPPLRVFSPLSPVLSPSRTIKLSGSTENRKASRSQRAPRVSSNVKPISSDAQPLIDRDTPTFSEFHRRQNLLGNFVAISETSFETLVGFSKQLANWNLVDSLGGGGASSSNESFEGISSFCGFGSRHKVLAYKSYSSVASVRFEPRDTTNPKTGRLLKLFKTETFDSGRRSGWRNLNFFVGMYIIYIEFKFQITESRRWSSPRGSKSYLNESGRVFIRRCSPWTRFCSLRRCVHVDLLRTTPRSLPRSASGAGNSSRTLEKLTSFICRQSLFFIY